MQKQQECSEQVWHGGAWSGTKCRNKAKVERNGKWFCGVHDPERKRVEQEKRDTLRSIESAIQSARWEVRDAEIAAGRALRKDGSPSLFMQSYLRDILEADATLAKLLTPSEPHA